MSKKQLKPEEEKPIEIPEESETLDFSNPDFKFTPGRHVWRQHGPYLICNACVLQHATFIGMDKVMIGEEEDGTPILKKREELTQEG